MSESRPEEAREIVVAVADRVARIAEHLEAKEDTVGNIEAMDEDRDLELPPIQTRGLLARLLLEHEDYTLALRMVETIRNEDDEDVEGCYLEGWGWYCRGKALEEASKEKDDAGVTMDECYVEALSALLECQSVCCGSSVKANDKLTWMHSCIRNKITPTKAFSRIPTNWSRSSRARAYAWRWTRRRAMSKCNSLHRQIHRYRGGMSRLYTSQFIIYSTVTRFDEARADTNNTRAQSSDRSCLVQLDLVS